MFSRLLACINFTLNHEPQFQINLKLNIQAGQLVLDLTTTNWLTSGCPQTCTTGILQLQKCWGKTFNFGRTSSTFWPRGCNGNYATFVRIETSFTGDQKTRWFSRSLDFQKQCHRTGFFLYCQHCSKWMYRLVGRVITYRKMQLTCFSVVPLQLWCGWTSTPYILSSPPS